MSYTRKRKNYEKDLPYDIYFTINTKKLQFVSM